MRNGRPPLAADAAICWPSGGGAGDRPEKIDQHRFEFCTCRNATPANADVPRYRKRPAPPHHVVCHGIPIPSRSRRRYVNVDGRSSSTSGMANFEPHVSIGTSRSGPNGDRITYEAMMRGICGDPAGRHPGRYRPPPSRAMWKTTSICRHWSVHDRQRPGPGRQRTALPSRAALMIELCEARSR